MIQQLNQFLLTFDYIARLQLQMVGFFAAVRLDADDSHAGKEEAVFGRGGVVTASASAVRRTDTRTVADDVALIDARLICKVTRSVFR